MRGPVRVLSAGVVLGAGVAFAPPALAGPQHMNQSRTVVAQGTDWASTVVVDRFDPALGELVGVELEVRGHVEADVALENPTDTPVTVTATATAQVRLERTGSAWAVTADAAMTHTSDLLAYDGVTDYGGSSGDTHHLHDDPVASTYLVAPADLAPFIGAGTVALGLRATAITGTGGAPVMALLTVLAGADAQVGYTYLADERAPDPPIVTEAPAAVTNDLTPTLAFTVADDPLATTTCQLVHPGPEDPWLPCTSPWTAVLPAGTNGAHAMSVRATDRAGNVGEPSTVGFLVDTVAPAAPSIATTPVSPSPNARPAWSFTTDPGTTTTCHVDAEAAVPCSHAYTADLTALADGPHTFRVVATDAAGNVGPEAIAHYVLDRVRPEQPTVAARPASPSSDPTPTWTVAAETGASLACSLDGGPYIACDATHTVDLTGALDGDHTIAIRATDPAGNVGDPVVEHHLLDRDGPDQPVITGPSVGNDSTPTFSFTGETGARFECSVDASPTVACDGGIFEPQLTADNVYVITVVAIDAAGNHGDPATGSYRLDTVRPPAPMINGRPPEATPNDHPAWTFTVGQQRTSECAVDGGVWVPCTDSFTADLGLAPDGLHRFAVRAIDLAGNIGMAAQDTFELDRSAPPAPTITSAPVTPGRGLAPTWTFEAPTDATTECSTDGVTWERCLDQATVALPTDATAAVVDLQVRARDGAGNTSLPAVSTYTLDRAAPARPEITAAPSTPSTRTSAKWTFTVEDDADAECMLDGGGWEPCSGGFAVLFPPGVDGPHIVEIRATDPAGNISESATGEYVLDTTPPSAPIVVGGPAPASIDDTPTWTFSYESGATIECRIDDGAWAPCVGTLEVDLTGDDDGTHAVEVRATDAVGNIGPVTAAAFLLDRVAPAPPAFTVTPASPGRDRGPAWGFTAEEGGTTECAFGDGPWTACDGAYEADLADADDGTYALAVRTTDAAGNRSEPVLGAYELDTVAPPPPDVSGPAGPTNDTTPEWHLTVESGAAPECAVDDGSFVPCPTLFTVSLDEGVHRFALRAVDAAGNVSPVGDVEVVVDTVAPPPPDVRSIPSATNPGWGVAAVPGSVAECSVDGGPWAPCADLVPSAGATRLDVRAVDAAGNRSGVVTVGAPAAPPVEPVVPAAGAGPGLAPARSDGGPTPRSALVVVPTSVAVAVPADATAAPEGALPPGTGSDAAATATQLRPETVLGNLLPVLPPEVALLIQNAVERSSLPVALIAVVVAFVAIQDRLDRRDPKLAQARLRHEPEYLEFK